MLAIVPFNGEQPLRTNLYQALVRSGMEVGDVDDNPVAIGRSAAGRDWGCGGEVVAVA